MFWYFPPNPKVSLSAPYFVYHSLGPCYLKWSSWTSSDSITWELLRDAERQTSPQTGCNQICILTGFPGDWAHTEAGEPLLPSISVSLSVLDLLLITWGWMSSSHCLQFNWHLGNSLAPCDMAPSSVNLRIDCPKPSLLNVSHLAYI